MYKVITQPFRGIRLRITLSLLVLLTSYMNLLACDCDNPPNTFVTSLSEYTAEFEVVQIDTYQISEAPLFIPVVLSKLKVIKTFGQKLPVKYIWIAKSTGPDCQRGLSPKKIGHRYIITGKTFQDKRYQQWYDEEERRNFLYVTSCGKTILDVEENFVYGVITKNNDKKIKENYDRLMMEDPEKAQSYYDEVYLSKHHVDLVQKMSKETFYKLMDDRALILEK